MPKSSSPYRGYKRSVLSEYSLIQNWLNTPKGYYVDKPDFGNILDELLFKSRKNAEIKLGFVMDEIINDLGYEVASEIVSINLVGTKELDKFIILITLRSGHQLGKEV